MSREISFDQWVGVDQHGAKHLARDPEVKPLLMRVMFAGMGWSNLIGHAEFAQGGLAMILQSANPRTGEIHIPSRRQVNEAITRAKAMGIVGEDSTFRCIVAPDWWEKAGGNGGKSCSTHGIRPPKRDRRSPATTGKRDKTCPAPGQDVSRSEPLTCTDANPSMTLLSQPVRQDRNPDHSESPAS